MRAAPLLPPPRRATALPWLVAATTVMLLLACTFALVLGGAADGVRRVAGDRLIVQVIDADARARLRTADRVAALLRDAPEVRSVDVVPEGEVARLIRPYISGMDAAALPLPALIEATLAPSADGHALAERLSRLPHVHASLAAEDAAPLAAALGGLRAAAAIVAASAAAATALIAALAAHAAFTADRATLDTLHTLGATDRQLAYLVSARIGRSAAIGAMAGALAALAVLLGLRSGFSTLGFAGLSPGGWLIVAALPVALALLAAGTAQAALVLRLRRQP